MQQRQLHPPEKLKNRGDRVMYPEVEKTEDLAIASEKVSSSPKICATLDKGHLTRNERFSRQAIGKC
nr:hypothetical protein [Desertifilum tharense]